MRVNLIMLSILDFNFFSTLHFSRHLKQITIILNLIKFNFNLAKVSTSALEAQEMGFFKKTTNTANRTNLIKDAKNQVLNIASLGYVKPCLLYTSPSPRD